MSQLAPNFTVRIDQVSPSKWAALLGRFDDASVYQSWSYGAVCWDPRQLSHLVLERAGEPVAIAQVRLVTLPVLGKGIAYIRWGPLWRRHGQPAEPEILRQALLALQAEYIEKRGLLLRLVPNAFQEDPAGELCQAVCSGLGFALDPRVHVYRTMRVDLSQSVEDLRKGLHSRWRNYLKNAEKSDYELVEGATVELYDVFLSLYREMMARKQFDTTVDVDEFRRLQQDLPAELKMQVFVCRKDGQALNALVVSAIGESAIYLLAATGEAGLKERGAHLLQWRAMQWLKDHGCRWYDVGGINPDRNPGVFQFKSGLGGQEIRQLGGFELHGDWVNSFVVSCGERLRAGLRSLKKRRVPAPAAATAAQ